MAIIKIQQPNGQFREAGRCSDDMGVIQNRMRNEAQKNPGRRIRVEDSQGRLVDSM